MIEQWIFYCPVGKGILTIKKSRYQIALFIVTVLLAIAGRWYTYQRIPIGIDEPVYLNASLAYNHFFRTGDWKGLAWYDENAEHPALAKLVYGSALFFLPPIDQIQEKDMRDGSPIQETEAKGWILQARLVSVILGVAVCGVLAWFYPTAGLLLAVQTSSVRYTSLVGLEALPLLTSLLSVLMYEKWIKAQKEENEVKSWRWLAFSSIMLGLTAASKYVFCIAGIAISVHLVWKLSQDKWPIRRVLQVLLLYGLLAVAVFFIANPFLWPRPINRLVESVIYHIRFSSNDHVSRYQYPFWQPLLYLSSRSGSADWYLFSMDGLIFLLAFIGMYALRRKPLYLIWLVFSLGFLLVWKTKWEQYVMVALIPYCLAAGEGVKMLWNWGKKRLRQQTENP